MGNIFRLFEAPREQVIPLLSNDVSSRYSAEITSQSEVPKPETDGWRLSPRNKKRKRSRSRTKRR
jgi:hypothetical protein